MDQTDEIGRRKQRGGDHKSAAFKKSMGSREPIDPKRSADELGEKIGVSGATIKRVRAVLASDEEEVISQLLAGDIAPNTAYNLVRRARTAKADSAE